MRSLIEFIFPLRLHRLAYFVRLVVANICSSFLYASNTTMDPRYWWGSVVVLAIYGLFFILLPRLRDAGMSGWWLLVSLVPIANILLGIILLFRPPEYHFSRTSSESDAQT